MVVGGIAFLMNSKGWFKAYILWGPWQVNFHCSLSQTHQSLSYKNEFSSRANSIHFDFVISSVIGDCNTGALLLALGLPTVSRAVTQTILNVPALREHRGFPESGLCSK